MSTEFFYSVGSYPAGNLFFFGRFLNDAKVLIILLIFWLYIGLKIWLEGCGKEIYLIVYYDNF